MSSSVEELYGPGCFGDLEVWPLCFRLYTRWLSQYIPMVFSVSLIDKPETCASTTSSVLSRHFQRKVLTLASGAPCSGNKGYCDKFNMCRLLDADGPIARLKNSFLNLDDFDDIAEWMKVKDQFHSAYDNSIYKMLEEVTVKVTNN